MYTILLGDNNELTTSVKERIMQRSKLVDNLHFLVEPMYKDIDMSDFTVTMEYLMPVSREYRTETLVKSDELYKSKLEYKLPFDSALTKEAGNIEVQLTFTRVILKEDGTNVQQVRKTSPTTITVLPISAWSDIIPDGALTALDQRIIATQAMLEAANEMMNYINDSKADNMVYDVETQTLQLTSGGSANGRAINIGYVGNSVVSIALDEHGDMFVYYSNGTFENLGQVSGEACAGTYIPSYKENGTLIFELSKEPTEERIELDINENDEWHPIEGDEQPSTFVWEML